MALRNPVKSFLGGLILTIVLVVVVPVVIDTFAVGYLEQLVGDRTFLMLSSDVIVSILVWIIVLGCMFILGAGGVFRKFGVIGVLGLVAAYWLLGDVTDAIIPVATLVVVMVVIKVLERRRKGKAGSR